MSKTMRLGLTTMLLGIGLVLGAMAQGATTPATAAPAAPPLRQENQVTLAHLIKSGGWAMWPLGACSFATVTLMLLNFQRISRNKLLPQVAIAQIKGAAATGDVQQVWNLTNATDSMFTRSLAAGLRQFQADDPAGSRRKMEEAIAETAGREESRYAFFVNFLALLTSMSPMWGLLGTVSGMIGAFSKIGGGGMGKPEMLAKNISEALVCTATGLLIAIVSMGFYFLFRNLLNAIMKESEGFYSEVLDAMLGQGNAFGEAGAAAAQAADVVPGAGTQL